MKRLLVLFAGLFLSSVAALPQVVIDPAVETGPVKMMNASNNYPLVNVLVQALEVPYMRTHDSKCQSYGTKIVDINAVFPDFDKDPDNPANYDFHYTDTYLKGIIDNGSKPYYRLGQSCESGKDRIGPVPPKDFKKWAVICEHIVRHYNEGWADGFKMGIEYWEIWNEANMDSEKYGLIKNPRNPSFWAGTDEEYYRLYTTTAKHLKKCFPDIKVGGPAFAGSYDQTWIDNFLKYVKKEKAPLDFFSYHKYASHPSTLVQLTREVRARLDAEGFTDIGMHLGEWNYVKAWGHDGEVYSNQVRRSVKGAAFVAATMSALQKEPVEMLNYYDLRSTTGYNGAFDRATSSQVLLPGYYALFSWTKLSKLGTTVQSEVKGLEDVFATAATSKDGKMGILVVRYNDDDSVYERERVEVSVKGRDLSGVVCHLTDFRFLFTEFPISVKDGKIVLYLYPNCFAYIELR
ncbi:MAG: hypothetical protein IJL56_06400 [Bacteroidales bacterium]|nr:hypothetical protein [Bacteroidales bacterium]